MATHNDRFNDLISNTQSIATDLLEFQSYVPNAANISALVSELHAISAGLQDLFTASNDPRNFHDARCYADARWAVVETLKRTLEDLDRYIRGKNRRSGRSRQEVYSTIWVDLNNFFLEQSNNILFDRLNCFKLFLEELVFVLKGGSESRDFEVLYQRIDRLLAIQDEDLSQELRRLELQRDALATPAKAKSWERKRPGRARPRDHSPPVAPQPPAAAAGINRHHPASPVSPSGPGHFWNPGPDPVRPVSPPTSSASTASPSSASPSSAGSEMPNHWLRLAFAQDRPTTNFSMTSTESALFDSHNRGIIDHLRKNKYAELLILRFDNNIEVRIYVRDKDRKVRIYCKNEKTVGKKIVSCRPITKLHIHRQESNLQLYEIDKDKRGRMWLVLKFPNYERMILFFCAFLALKREDRLLPDGKLDGHVLPEEKHVFSCTIYDNHCRHALQIFKDERSEGIRLQASILGGEKKTTPVWTAFINYKICAFKWIKRVEPYKIHLSDLPRYVFSNDYTPHMCPNGEHEIHFDDAEDADRFTKVIEDLADHKI